MKKVYVIILMLGVFIGSELFVLSIIERLKTTPSKNPEQISIVKEIVRFAKTNDPVVKKKNLQSLFIEDIKSYIQNPEQQDKKLLTAMSYTGTIQKIENDKPNLITIVVEDENDIPIQMFVDWKKDKFMIYKRESSNLLKSDLNSMKVGDTVQIREFEEVLKDSMTVEDTKKIVNYVEVTLID